MPYLGRIERLLDGSDNIQVRIKQTKQNISVLDLKIPLPRGNHSVFLRLQIVRDIDKGGFNISVIFTAKSSRAEIISKIRNKKNIKVEEQF